jgi:hypothetical protein
MWFTSLLASRKRSAGYPLTERLAEVRRRQRQPDALRACPHLEVLEDRTLLSIMWVPGNPPGEWSDPGNWIDGMVHRVPGPTDDVVLPSVPAGTYTVSAPSSCRSLSFDDPAALSIRGGGILGVYGPATVNGALDIEIGGTLESRAGDPWTINRAVTLSGRLGLPGAASTDSSHVNGSVTWTGGAILGGSSPHPVMLDNTITISGPDRKALGAILNVNQDARIVHQGGDLNDGDATLNLSGTYELQTDARITNFTDYGYFNVENTGVLLKSGGTGVATVGGAFTVSAGGQVVNQTGTLELQLDGNGTDTGGTFVVAQGARVRLVASNGGGPGPNFTGIYTGSGRGTVELATNIAVSPGAIFHFPGPVDPPIGDLSQIISHLTGAENGLSDITAPVNSLVGVFLGPNQPDQSPPPAALDFSTADSRDYASLSPTLQQVFYIGDGLTSTGGQHQLIVPAGATRLFLGTMDGFEWRNDAGALSVQVGINGTPLDQSFPFLVPGISDPWLAGMPDGSTASVDDVAPAQSPALVPDLAVQAGDVLTFTAAGSVNFYPSMFEWTNGIIFSRNGGTLTNTGFMRIPTSNPFGVDLEAPMNNSGTITQTGGLVNIGASGGLNNHGLYDLQSDTRSITGYVFNNEADGIFRKSLSTGLANPDCSSFNNHGGIIDVQRGTLDLSNSSGSRTHTGGIFYTADGTTFIAFGGTFTGAWNGAKAGSGVVKLNVGTDTVGTGGVVLNFQQDGMLQWGGTSIVVGPDGLVNNGSLTLVGSISRSLSGTGVLTNNGRIIHTGTSSLSMSSGTTLVNNGFYDLQGDASVGGQQGGTFQNNGAFIKSQGTGTSSNNHWVNTSGGLIDVESGTLTLTDSFTNEGMLDVRAGQLILGSFTNYGTLFIAAGSTVRVNGNYTQDTNATLAVQLDGTAPGQSGPLAVSGSATLDGILVVSLLDPTMPPAPGTYEFMTYGSHSGMFDPARSSIDPNFTGPFYNSQDVTLVV